MGRLGELERLLLLALVRLDEEAYGVEIRQVIARRTGRTLSPGAIYTALDRLERRGLVASRLGEPTPERGGKRKRYYRVTPAGSTVLRRSQAAIAKMARDLEPGLELP
jgi:DNA-binding PadR family transcriptional regulator